MDYSQLLAALLKMLNDKTLGDFGGVFSAPPMSNQLTAIGNYPGPQFGAGDNNAGPSPWSNNAPPQFGAGVNNAGPQTYNAGPQTYNAGPQTYNAGPQTRQWRNNAGPQFGTPAERITNPWAITGGTPSMAAPQRPVVNPWDITNPTVNPWDIVS